MKNKFKGLFGEFSGRIGNLLVYELNGQTVVRTRPAGPQKKATGKRKQYQDDFRYVMRLMQMALEIVKIGFMEKDKKGTGFKKALGVNLKKYRALDRPKTLEWIELSRGELASANDLQTEILINGQLKITWDTTKEVDNSHPHDLVMLLLVNETNHDFMFSRQNVQRSKGELIENIPPQKEGEIVRGFISFYSTQGNTSDGLPLVSNSQTFVID